MGRHAIKTPPHHATWAEFLDVWKAAASRLEPLANALASGARQ